MGESRLATRLKRFWYNFEEFCTLIPEGQKADLIDGVIYVASPDNVAHYEVYFWLSVVIDDYQRRRKVGGKVFGSRIAFRLDDRNSPEPDVAYLGPERVHLIQEGHIDGPPDLAVEIISPSSIERDYEKKRKQYERFGVQEYWIIDPLEEKMTCFRLGRDGSYRQVRLRAGKIVSQVIPGFWVRPAWFWQSPLPDKDVTLREILGDRAAS